MTRYPQPPACIPARQSRAWIWLASLWLAAGNAGCSLLLAPLAPILGPSGFVQDQVAYNDTTESVILGWRNHVWSKRAWYQQRHLFAAHPYVVDFGEGFRSGYLDVANGGDGCVPVLPPRKYWSWRYQSPEGQAKTNAWFEGYPLGAAAAQKDGIAHWGEIATGYTADSKSIRGRANYVRIRDELLKRERRKQHEQSAEEVGAGQPAQPELPRAPDALPPLIPLREPDDLPPPNPKPADPLKAPTDPQLPPPGPNGLEPPPANDQTDPQARGPRRAVPAVRASTSAAPVSQAQSVAWWEPAAGAAAAARPIELPTKAASPVSRPTLARPKPAKLRQPLPPLTEAPAPPELRYPAQAFRLEASEEMLDSLLQN